AIAAVIFLRDTPRGPALVHTVILTDQVCERPRVAVIHRDLPAPRTTQRRAIELLYSRKPARRRHLIKSVQKRQRRFLVLRRELMRVIPFHHRDPIPVLKALV